MAASILVILGAYVFFRTSPDFTVPGEDIGLAQTVGEVMEEAVAVLADERTADVMAETVLTEQDRPRRPSGTGTKAEVTPVLTAEVMPSLAWDVHEKKPHKEVELPDFTVFEEADGSYRREVIVIPADSLDHYLAEFDYVEIYRETDEWPEAENFFAETETTPEEDDFQPGIGGLFTQDAVRRLADRLGRLSPIKVYEDENKKVVEFASIPVSKKYKP